jgi:HEAT repeat protein
MRKFLLVGLLAVWTVAAGCGQQQMGTGNFFRMLFPPSLGTRVRELESEDPGVRRDAALAIGKHRRASRYPKVVELMCLVARSDPERTVRAAATRSLGRLEGESVLEALAGILKEDKSPWVRTHAAVALGKHEKSDAVLEPLVEALRTDPDVDVRLAAAEVLRDYKQREAAEALSDAVGDSDIAVSSKSWKQLRFMTGQDLPRETAPWKEYLATAEAPFDRYGHPPPMPKGEDQRPFIREGLGDAFRRAFEKDVHEEELK